MGTKLHIGGEEFLCALPAASLTRNLGIRLILNNLLRFDHRFLFPDPADDPSWRVRDILPWAQFPQEAFKAAERGCQLINVLSCLADLCVEGLHFGLHKHSSCFLL